MIFATIKNICKSPTLLPPPLSFKYLKLYANILHIKSFKLKIATKWRSRNDPKLLSLRA